MNPELTAWGYSKVTQKLITALKEKELEKLRAVQDINSDPATTEMKIRVLVAESKALRSVYEIIQSGEFFTES